MDVFEKFYLDHQDADGNLTDAQTAQMLALDPFQGDTDTQLSESDVPDIDATPAEAKSPPETLPAEAAQPEPEPVVLAKDGVHTIPFEKLEEARQQAQHWARVAAEKDAEIARLAAAAAQAPTTPATEETQPPEEGEVSFGDYSDEDMKKGVQAVAQSVVAKAVADINAKFEQVLAPIKAQEQTTALEAHFKALTDANPDHNEIAAGKPLQDWIESQPSFVRDHYKAVFERGTTSQVIELVSTFKKQSGYETPAPTAPAVTAAQKAKEVIASAKNVRPTSLTDIPSGSTAHHDEAEAVREMTSTGLMAKFSNVGDRDKIMAQLDRLV